MAIDNCQFSNGEKSTQSHLTDTTFFAGLLGTASGVALLMMIFTPNKIDFWGKLIGGASAVMAPIVLISGNVRAYRQHGVEEDRLQGLLSKAQKSLNANASQVVELTEQNGKQSTKISELTGVIAAKDAEIEDIGAQLSAEQAHESALQAQITLLDPDAYSKANILPLELEVTGRQATLDEAKKAVVIAEAQLGTAKTTLEQETANFHAHFGELWAQTLPKLKPCSFHTEIPLDMLSAPPAFSMLVGAFSASNVDDLYSLLNGPFGHGDESQVPCSLTEDDESGVDDYLTDGGADLHASISS